MPDLKLAKLPDRTPVKLSLTITSELASALGASAAAYRDTYGQEESIAELVPAMLTCFLDSDRALVRSRSKP